MNKEELPYWLALNQTYRFNGKHIKPLLDNGQPLSVLFNHHERALKNLGLTPAKMAALKAIDWQQVEKYQQWAEQPHQAVITFTDPRYPPLLKTIADPPLLLFARGNTDLLQEPQLAIVGSRNPTPTGTETAMAFADYLSQLGLVITSGMALGIDGTSHRGALKSQGPTIAVLGTGLDTIYPKTHANLAQEIADSGLLISEYPPHTPPKANLFPLRNRIISGLSLGVLVVEAALKSGSLITARLAGEQGREVFAIPGSIHNPLARGCHQLLRQGAKLVESSADIVYELKDTLQASLTAKTTGQMVNASAPEKKDQRPPWDSDYETLFKAIDYDPVTIDQLVRRTGLTTAKISSMLLQLEISGKIIRQASGYQIRR